MKLNIDCPILMINLDRSPERLEFQKKQFEEHGLQFERFPAVDGRKDNSELLNSIKLSDKWSTMSNGQKGCALSHYLILKKMVNENIDKLIVFEDDVILCEDFISNFNEYYDSVHLNYDIIYLGSQYSDEDFKKYKHLKTVNIGTFTTHAIIYTKKMAEKMLRFINENGLYIIDITYIDETRKHLLSVICYIKEPSEDITNKYKLIKNRSYGLCYQSDLFQSTIHQ